eukprot:Sspe_Gene.22970::Locus_8844_Transcript_2_3_Confidence_0.286_Length_1143::g.22970::m.22970/K00901/dgkA, DGK; diacylglycerol kinase (ATP)
MENPMLSSDRSANPQSLLKGRTVALLNSKSGERAAAKFVQQQLRDEFGDDCVIDLMDFIKKRVFPGTGIPLTREEFTEKGKEELWAGAEPDPIVTNTLLRKLGGAPDGGIVIVAGGDGTVAWGMMLVDKAFEGYPPSKKPFVGVIPMGTGNDLSRSLGFGGGFVREECSLACQCCKCCLKSDLREALHKIAYSHEAVLDRWEVSLRDSKGSEVPCSQPMMNNYLSVGFDACIATKFDTFRRNHPALCKTRMGNKVWYASFGMGALCGSPTLADKVRVTIDGKQVPQDRLKDLKNIILTNIDSFASGMRVWHPGKKDKAKYSPQRSDDQLIEVCGYYGSSHMGLAQVRLRASKRI